MSEIVFVHGLFQNPRSWAPWVAFFEARGHHCHAPAWPLHEGDPESLRTQIPAGFGDLTLKDVTGAMRDYLDPLGETPVVVGHSVGGLVAQILVTEGRASAGAAICPVAPNGMLSLEWGFVKNLATIVNPLMGDAPMEMDAAMFHSAFSNVMTEDASAEAWERTAVPGSRNVLRSAMGAAGNVNLSRGHGPLLFVGAAEDRMIPPSLVVKNFEAYEESGGEVTYREFARHGHFICGEPGWEDVADFIARWIETEASGAGEAARGVGIAEAVS